MEKSKLDNVINILRSCITEEVPTMNLGTGKIAGTPEADPGNPPVDLRKKKHRTWNPFFKNLARIQRRSK
jgi:hypothetical protein